MMQTKEEFFEYIYKAFELNDKARTFLESRYNAYQYGIQLPNTGSKKALKGKLDGITKFSSQDSLVCIDYFLIHYMHYLLSRLQETSGNENSFPNFTNEWKNFYCSAITLADKCDLWHIIIAKAKHAWNYVLFETCEGREFISSIFKKFESADPSKCQTINHTNQSILRKNLFLCDEFKLLEKIKDANWSPQEDGELSKVEMCMLVQVYCTEEEIVKDFECTEENQDAMQIEGGGLDGTNPSSEFNANSLAEFSDYEETSHLSQIPSVELSKTLEIQIECTNTKTNTNSLPSLQSQDNITSVDTSTSRIENVQEVSLQNIAKENSSHMASTSANHICQNFDIPSTSMNQLEINPITDQFIDELLHADDLINLILSEPLIKKLTQIDVYIKNANTSSHKICPIGLPPLEQKYYELILSNYDETIMNSIWDDTINLSLINPKSQKIYVIKQIYQDVSDANEWRLAVEAIRNTIAPTTFHDLVQPEQLPNTLNLRRKMFFLVYKLLTKALIKIPPLTIGLNQVEEWTRELIKMGKMPKIKKSTKITNLETIIMKTPFCMPANVQQDRLEPHEKSQLENIIELFKITQTPIRQPALLDIKNLNPNFFVNIMRKLNFYPTLGMMKKGFYLAKRVKNNKNCEANREKKGNSQAGQPCRGTKRRSTNRSKCTSNETSSFNNHSLASLQTQLDPVPSTSGIQASCVVPTNCFQQDPNGLYSPTYHSMQVLNQPNDQNISYFGCEKNSNILRENPPQCYNPNICQKCLASIADVELETIYINDIIGCISVHKSCKICRSCHFRVNAANISDYLYSYDESYKQYFFLHKACHNCCKCGSSYLTKQLKYSNGYYYCESCYES